MTTILLVDEHAIVRQGVRALLQAEPDFSVVGEAGEALEAIGLADRLAPAVIVLELSLPGIDGTEVLRQVGRRHPATRVVVLTRHGEAARAAEALRHGAAAYVLKSAGASDLVRAIREAVAGRRYLSPPLSERAVESHFTREAPPDAYDLLTPRERQVLQLSAAGLTTAEIAARLAISPRTAEAHRGRMMHKLSLRTQTDLIRFALRRGLVPPENSDPP
jgi:DNA-binding NarL/FixJ family response regulator